MGSLEAFPTENITYAPTYLTGSNVTGPFTVNLTTTLATLATNSTDNVTEGAPIPPPVAIYPIWAQALILTILGVFIVGTIIGNSLVCIAVAIVKKLQTPSNLLIVSLALSDLLVAVLVMPIAAAIEVLGYWPFNNIMCDLWTSSDVTMCTASILNLCIISVDRYFVITRPFQYAIKRTPRRMGLMIAGVWSASVLISVPPVLGWKSIRGDYVCQISQEIGYQVYATFGAFYLPLIVMIVIYFRIWRVSSRLARKERSTKVGSIDKGTDHFNLSTRSSGASDHLHIPNGSLRNGFSDPDEASTEMLSKKTNQAKRRFTIKSLLSRTSRSSTNSSKERKATKTLGIIMGGFTLCWLPFFILALIRPFKPEAIPQMLSSIFMWLGYFNSFMNPVIYARFNREFRTPFKEILCLRCKGINVRLRSESYVEQYGPDRDRDRDRDRDSLRPPHDSIVRYNSQGQTVVHVGNGNTKNMGESRI